jgi:hypothetical protein
MLMIDAGVYGRDWNASLVDGHFFFSFGGDMLYLEYLVICNPSRLFTFCCEVACLA